MFMNLDHNRNVITDITLNPLLLHLLIRRFINVSVYEAAGVPTIDRRIQITVHIAFWARPMHTDCVMGANYANNIIDLGCST